MIASKEQILAFRQELIDYFNANIISNPDMETQVEYIENEVKLTNRGHGILFMIKDCSGGPIFYTEELMQSLTDKTIADIASILNRQASEFKAMHASLNVRMKNLDPDDHVIVTAIPTQSLSPSYSKDVEREQKDEIGLTVFLKTEVPNSPIPGTYMHVRKLTDNDDKKTIWDKAILNTLKYSGIEVIFPDPSTMFLVTDKHKFADYFYLTSTVFLSDIAKELDFITLYIFPQTAYDAIIFGVPKMLPYTDRLKRQLINILEQYDTQNPLISACKYDVITDTITAFTKDDLA